MEKLLEQKPVLKELGKEDGGPTQRFVTSMIRVVAREAIASRQHLWWTDKGRVTVVDWRGTSSLLTVLFLVVSVGGIKTDHDRYQQTEKEHANQETRDTLASTPCTYCHDDDNDNTTTDTTRPH
jgi:hypothetical protein